MRRHFAWRPHLDRDRLYNPFAPSERFPTYGHIEIEAPSEGETREPEPPPEAATDVPAEEENELRRWTDTD